MSSNKFDIARELAERGEFEAARAVLKTLPEDHPGKQKWLNWVDAVEHPESAAAGQVKRQVVQDDVEPPDPLQVTITDRRALPKRRRGCGFGIGCLVLLLVACATVTAVPLIGGWWLTTPSGQAFLVRQTSTLVASNADRLCESANIDGEQCDTLMRNVETCRSVANNPISVGQCVSQVGTTICAISNPDDASARTACEANFQLSPGEWLTIMREFNDLQVEFAVEQ